MVSRNATLQLMLNGQPLGTLPLGADGEDYANGKAKLRMDHHLIGRQGKADAPLPLTAAEDNAMVSRNATLQLMLNGQPLGTLPLGADGEDVSHYQLQG
jgi:hypothetical protein